MQKKLHIYPTLTVLSYLGVAKPGSLTHLNHDSKEFIENKIALIYKNISYTIQIDVINIMKFLKQADNLLKYVKEIQLMVAPQSRIKWIYQIFEVIQKQITGDGFQEEMFVNCKQQIKRKRIHKKEYKTKQAQVLDNNKDILQELIEQPMCIVDSDRVIRICLNIIKHTTIEDFDPENYENQEQNAMVHKFWQVLTNNNFKQQITAFKLKKIIMTNFGKMPSIKSLFLLRLFDCKELELNNSEVKFCNFQFQFENVEKLSLKNRSDRKADKLMFHNIKNLTALNCTLTSIYEKFFNIESLEVQETVYDSGRQFKLGGKQREKFPHLTSVHIDKSKTKQIVHLIFQQLQQLANVPKLYFNVKGFKFSYLQIIDGFKVWPEKCKIIIQKAQSNFQNCEGEFMFTFERDKFDAIKSDEMIEYNFQMKNDKQNTPKIYLKTKQIGYQLLSEYLGFYNSNYRYKVRITVTKFADLARKQKQIDAKLIQMASQKVKKQGKQKKVDEK